MSDYINIQTEEGQVVEVSIDEDGNIDLQTVMTNFGGTLRYINEDTGHYRLVRIANGKLQPPTGGWKSVSTYHIAPTREKRRSLPSVGTGGLPKSNQYNNVNTCISSGTDKQR